MIKYLIGIILITFELMGLLCAILMSIDENRTNMMMNEINKGDD